MAPTVTGDHVNSAGFRRSGLGHSDEAETGKRMMKQWAMPMEVVERSQGSTTALPLRREAVSFDSEAGGFGLGGM